MLPGKCYVNKCTFDEFFNNILKDPTQNEILLKKEMHLKKDSEPVLVPTSWLEFEDSDVEDTSTRAQKSTLLHLQTPSFKSWSQDIPEPLEPI